MDYNFRPIIAIAMVLLMVTGMIAPVTAIDVDDRARTVDDRRAAERVADLSALEHRMAAYEILAENDAQRQLDRLNQTFEHVVDANRIDARSVFHEDRLVVAQTQAHHPEAADHVVASDRALAETAVADAQRVRDQLQQRNHSYNETVVDEYLANASADLQAGHEHVRQDEPVAAVEAYQRAWTAAQRALDVLHRAVDPQVEITLRADPPHDGNVTYTVEGVVWTVRTQGVNATLTVNGETVPLALNTSTEPGANVTFERTVTLDRQVNRINVSVTVPVETVDYDRVGDRPPGDNESEPPGDGGPPGDDLENDSGGEVLIGFDVLKLDGDGLPDRYEMDTVGTDPLNPDSDSRFTEFNESDLGLLDGAKDFSGDGLIAYQEYHIGTNPLSVDTTGDGLRDYFQVRKAGTDPVVNDTDGDGTLDVDEDLSEDGLTLIEEQEHGTNPLINDTDADGLTDYEEIHEYGTDPLDPDTDDDGLTDSEELDLETDPLDPDTTGNSVLDGNETYTRTVADEESGVEVEITGEGYAGGEVTIEDLSNPNTSDVQVGPPVWISNETDFDNATVRVPLNATVDLTAQRSDLGLIKSELNGDGWERLDATVDAENRSLVATVESFSLVMAVNETKWADQRIVEFDPGWPYLDTFTDDDGWSGDGRIENGSLVVASGEAAFTVTEFDAPETATKGDTIGVTATIRNTGGQPATQQVAYVFAGSEMQVEEVHLKPGEQRQIRFHANPFEDHPDLTPLSVTYEHAVVTDDDQRNATITVFDRNDDTDDGDDGNDGDDEASFEVTGFVGTHEAMWGEQIDASATVTNTGGVAGETDVTYHFGGDQVASTTVALEPGETTTVTFTYRVPVGIDEGSYRHSIRATDGGDAAGDRVYVYIDDDVEIQWPRIQSLDGPQLCLPGQGGPLCSITTEPAQRRVTGHYGAATDLAGLHRARTANASERKSRASRSLDLTRVDETNGTVQIHLTYSAKLYAEPAAVSVRVIGPDETVTVVEETSDRIQSKTASTSTVSADLDRFAGEEVQIVVVAEGNATVEIHTIEVERDSDGDGIRDVAEIATDRKPMPITYVVENEERKNVEMSQNMSLDPYKRDTNGDGLSDGTQVEIEVTRENDPHGPGILGFKINDYSAVAHPNEENTDGVGLTDAEELENGSNPKKPQRVMIGIKYPVEVRKTQHLDGVDYMPETIDNAVVIAPSAKWPTKGDDPRSRPPWLPESVEVDEKYTYYKIPIRITINYKGLEDPDRAVPDFISFNIEDENPVYNFKIVDGNMGLHIFDDLEEGVNERHLTIKVKGVNSGDDNYKGNVELIDLGQIEASPHYYNDENPFSRIGEIDIRTDDLELIDFGRHDASILSRYSMEKLEEGFLWIMRAYTVLDVAMIAIFYSKAVSVAYYIMNELPPSGDVDFAATIYRTDENDKLAVPVGGHEGIPFVFGGPTISVVN